MPELIAVLTAKQKADFEDKKFFAAMQGVDIDKDSKSGQDKWEEIKTRALSGGKSSDPNDIMSLQGAAAKQAGFGIGMGLDAETIDETAVVTENES
jgi:hypothetical protein